MIAGSFKTSPEPMEAQMNGTLPTTTLIATGVLFGIATGVGIYQHVVNMPRWFASPPGSFGLIRQTAKQEARFWIPIQSALGILMIASVALNWRVVPRRDSLVGAVGIYLGVLIATGAYLAPRIVRFSKMSPETPWTAELSAGAHRWLALSWVRAGAMVVANVLILQALARR